MREGDGKFVAWGIEMAGSAAVAKEDITVKSFAPGTIFSVNLNPLRDGKNFGSANRPDLQVPQGHAPRSGQALQLGRGQYPTRARGVPRVIASLPAGRQLEFARWLAQTSISLTIQTHLWVIPTVQSIHIVAIGIVLSSVFMVDLRVFGWAWTDETLRQTTRRFAPWLWGALAVLLATGLLMVVGEPVRELLSLSFWLKMCLIGVGASLAIGFQLTSADTTAIGRPPRQALAGAVPGDGDAAGLVQHRDPRQPDRLRYVWGSWSPGANLK